MKTMKKLLLPLLLLVLTLSACNPGGNAPETKGYDLSGKTYYNTVDQFDNADHSKVWFGKDGTFILQENFYDGYFQIKGKWAVSENVATLTVEETGIGNFKTLVFEIQDEDTLILKTDISGSIAGDTFSTTEVKGGGSSGSGTTLPDNTGIAPTGEGVTTFYNASQEQDDKSFVVIGDDNSFTFVEIQGLGAVQIFGLVGSEGNVLMFSNFDSDFYDYNGNKVYNFEFEVYDAETLILLKDLASSRAGDIFTIDGKMREVFYAGPSAGSLGDSATVYVHGPYPTGGEPSPGCDPTLELADNGDFVFTENCYAWMGQYKGWYEKTATNLTLHVTDASTMQGFAGQDVTVIVFTIKDDKTLQLETTLCMSQAGETFLLQK